MDKKDEVLRLLPIEIRKKIDELNIDFNKLNEIRLRINKPIILLYENKEIFITPAITKTDFKETIEYVSNYSLYAFEEEIRQGFITVYGGHRVGVCGKIVLNDNSIKTIKNISSINIRVAHEVLGCANELINYELKNTLIISAPGCGKTTLLRDLIRQLSNFGHTVGVVDERCEIAACYQGVPQNDVGIRTDVLDACPKTEGLIMLIRAMSPDIIAVDEIGKIDDINAIKHAINSGCYIYATIHARNIDDIKRRSDINGLFERYIVLSDKKDRTYIIYNEDYKEMG